MNILITKNGLPKDQIGQGIKLDVQCYPVVLKYNNKIKI